MKHAYNAYLHRPLSEMMTFNEVGLNLLAAAALAKDNASIGLILDSGFDVDALNAGYACTTLTLLAQDGLVEQMILLLRRGASVDGLPVQDGTPLHMACWKGRVEAACVLIACGANLFAKTSGDCTPRDLCQDDFLRAILDRLHGTERSRDHKA